MVDYSKIRHLFTSISFLFPHLGASLESSSGHRPRVRLFATRDSALRLVLSELYLGLSKWINKSLKLTDLAPPKPRPTRSEQLAIGGGSQMSKLEGCESSGSFGFRNLIKTELTDGISLLFSVYQDSDQIQQDFIKI